MATLLILALALLAALIIWDHHIASPWTRDGSVRVQVANVTPQVSGQITEIRVVDNQPCPPGRRSLRHRSVRLPGGTRHQKAQLFAREPLMCRSSGYRRERRAHLTDLCHHTGGTAAICRQRHPGAGCLRRRASTGRPGRNQPEAHAGAQSGERLCHQPSAAARRLCPCRHDQHLGDRCGQLLDRRLFRGDQDGAYLHRRSRRSATDGLP